MIYPLHTETVETVSDAIEFINSLPATSNVQVNITHVKTVKPHTLFVATERRFKTKTINGCCQITHMADVHRLDQLFRHVEVGREYVISVDYTHDFNYWFKWFKEQEKLKNLVLSVDPGNRTFTVKRFY